VTGGSEKSDCKLKAVFSGIRNGLDSNQNEIGKEQPTPAEELGSEEGSGSETRKRGEGVQK